MASKLIIMGRIAKSYYSEDFKEKQLFYYKGLSEKSQRHFLGMEYERLGNGSKTYLSKVFGCSRHRIINGHRELSEQRNLGLAIDYQRQRKPGGGAKKKNILPAIR